MAGVVGVPRHDQPLAAEAVDVHQRRVLRPERRGVHPGQPLGDLVDLELRRRRAVEQAAAELGGVGGVGLGLKPAGVVGLRQPDALGRVRRLDGDGAVELPGEGDGPLQQRLLLGIAGLVLGPPGVEAGAIGGLVLAGQDDGLGVQAVLQGIHA